MRIVPFAGCGLVLGLLAIGRISAAGEQPASPPAANHRAAASASRASPPAGASSQETRSLRADRLAPRWELGDRWIVETASRPLQARFDIALAAAGPTIQWQFSVQRFEKSLEADCFRIEIRCTAGGRQPETVLWVDRQSLVLRQVQTQIPTPGGFRTITQSYEFAGAQPTPVLGPLTALPVDLPLLTGGEAKQVDSYSYTTYSGPRGTKAIGDLGFTWQVKQSISPADAGEVRSLVKETFAKGLEGKPVAEVRLEGGGRAVRQLWQAECPWPVYSDNGSTISRLVRIIPAGSEDDSQREPHQ